MGIKKIGELVGVVLSGGGGDRDCTLHGVGGHTSCSGRSCYHERSSGFYDPDWLEQDVVMLIDREDFHK